MRELRELAILAQVKVREGVQKIRALRRESLLKASVISAAGILLWTSLFLLFRHAFAFLHQPGFQDFKPIILHVVFPAFFLCLGMMMAVSSGVIAHSGLFHAQETAFLETLPARRTSIFLVKFVEVAVFSSWAFIFLGVPLVAAFASTEESLPRGFVPMSLLFFAFFLWIPVSAGTLCAILLNRLVPSGGRGLGTPLFIAGAFATGIGLWHLVHGQPWSRNAADTYLHVVLDRFSFGGSPFYPTFWVGRGLLEYAEGNGAESLFYLALVASNALFGGMVCYLAAGRLFAEASALARSRGGGSRFRIRMILFHAMRPALVLFERLQRTLIEKDLRVFFRDSTQWSQFMIFFGLLAVYFLNLHRLPYDVNQPYWGSLVSFLNLSATSLTLCTFTSRFVFPMISLEGRKFWILGLLPVSRRDILVSKFLFAFTGSVAVSGGLMLISDLQIGVPAWLVWVHLYVVALISLGLAGLSAGLGALYPNFREDNPSKIVSGFGGTLNLILGLVFITLVVMLHGIPTHLGYARASWSQAQYRLYAGWSLAGASALAAAAAFIPLWKGKRAFERMEI